MKYILSMALVLLMSFSVGCGKTSSSKIKSDLRVKGAPGWVEEGTRVVKNKRGRLLHGIGLAQPIPDKSLQITIADNRARAQIAQILSTHIDQAIKDYTESTDGSVSSTLSNNINAQSKTLISGSIIKARWKDKNTGDLYSFAELDRKKIEGFIKTAENINQGFKDFYLANGEKSFDDLSSN